MKRSSVGIQKEPTIMIIPMIDIVFFLLGIFHDEYVVYEYRGTNSYSICPKASRIDGEND